MRLSIHCCKYCVAPKRHQGCHATCKEYNEEKVQLNKDKNKLRNDIKNVPNFSIYDFDEIAYTKHCKSKRR